MVTSSSCISQFDNLELRLPDLRLDQVTLDSLSGDLISITSINQHIMPGGDTVGTLGGDDLLVTRQNEDFTVIDYLELGSAFNDVAALLLYDGVQATIGGSFWDTVFIDDLVLNTHMAGRGIFLAALNANFQRISGTSLSADHLIRLGDGVLLKNGNLLTIGWVRGDLYIKDELVKSNHQGLFLIEWQKDFTVVQLKFWTATGRMDRASLFSNGNQTIAIVSFQDSLLFDEHTLVTRSSQYSNTAMIKLDDGLNSTAHLFFHSTFYNNYILDKQSETENISVIMNFRGNLNTEDIMLNGLPQSDQSVHFIIDNQLNILAFDYYNSSTGGTILLPTSTSKNLFVGSGKFSNWLESPPSSPWVCRDVGGLNPLFLEFVGDDVIFDKTLERQDQLIVTGIYKGLLQVGELSEFNNTNLYQPFALSFNSITETSNPNDVIVVLPNPVNDQFEIKPIIHGAEFYIWNTAGKLILSGPITEKINVTSIIPGFYILEIRAGDKKLTQSFIRSPQSN